MNKDKVQVNSRKEFVRLSLNDPKKAAEIISEKAAIIESSTRSSEVVKTLSELLYLSEKTIYLDCADNR